MAMEEMQDWISVVKYLAQEHAEWVLRYTNVYFCRHEELIPIIVVAKAYNKKAEKGKKVK